MKELTSIPSKGDTADVMVELARPNLAGRSSGGVMKFIGAVFCMAAIGAVGLGAQSSTTRPT